MVLLHISLNCWDAEREQIDLGVIAAGPTLTHQQAVLISKEVDMEEVRNAIFSIGDDKSPVHAFSRKLGG